MDPKPFHRRATKRLLLRVVATVAMLAAFAAGMAATAGPANASHPWLTDPDNASSATTVTWNRIYIDGNEMRVELRQGYYGGNKYVWARHSYCCGSGKYIELRVTKRYTNEFVGRSYRYIPTRRYTAGFRANGHSYNYEACIYRLDSLGFKKYLVCTGAAGIS